MKDRDKFGSMFSILLRDFPPIISCSDIDKYLDTLKGHWYFDSLDSACNSLNCLKMGFHGREYYLREDLVYWFSEHFIMEGGKYESQGQIRP